jgi:hypothetical protein
MSIDTARLAARESQATIRARRRRLAADAAAGHRLSVIILDHGTVLRGVPIRSLVEWIPSVGPIKSARLTRGLPRNATLGDLDDTQHALLLVRLRNYEHRHRNGAAA